MVTKTTLESFKNITVFSTVLITLLILQGCASPGGQLKSFVEKGKFEEAAKVYEEHKDYFQKNKEKNRESVSILVENLNKSYEPALQSMVSKLNNIAWPTDKTKWATIKRELHTALELLDEYNAYEILQEKDFRLLISDNLQSVLQEKRLKIRYGAKDAFLNFNHFGKQSFFDMYPVLIEPRRFMSDHFKLVCTILKSVNTQKIENFARLYRVEYVLSPENFSSLSNLYISAYFGEKTNRDRPDFKTIMDSLQAAKQCGFTPSEIPDMKVGFAKIESKNLLENELIEFPIQLEADLPFEVIQADSNSISIENQAQGFDYLVIFHVLEGNIKRQATSREEISSKFQSGTVPVPNPDYRAAEFHVIDCQNRLNQLLSDNRYNPNLFTAFAIGSVRKQLNNAMLQMRSIPAYINKPIYENYKFSRVGIEATKTLRAKYYIVDCIKNSYFTKDTSVTEKDNFTILYGLHDKDISRYRFSRDTSSEDVLEEWGQSSIIVKISNIAKYCKPSYEVKKLISLEAIETEMLNNESAIIQKYKMSSPKFFDPRFESVVVVLNPEGKLGAGFFVKPDVVLTNFHVVQGVKYVEIKTYGGEETFGKVVRSDIRLDLALVKVQTRGKPVKFYDELQINPGEVVEAIGHPKGLEFSITRGVVSAIRKFPSSYAPDTDDVLVIQTDAAINPGNSGGPLFLQDKVVGVNTQKWVKTDIEGLGFAIHCSEVLRFIEGE